MDESTIIATAISTAGLGGVSMLWTWREYQQLRKDMLAKEQACTAALERLNVEHAKAIDKVHSDYAARLEALHERHMVDLRAHEERAVMVAERAHSVLDRVAHAIARARSTDDGPDPTNHPTPPSRPAGFGGSETRRLDP